MRLPATVRRISLIFLLLMLPVAACKRESGGKSAALPPLAKPVQTPGPAPGPVKRLFTKLYLIAVRMAPDNESFRMGYLRAGSILQSKPLEPVPTVKGQKGCRKGWYELETGGFVCDGRDVIAFEGDKLPEIRALQPDLEAPLPYPYGRNLYESTPVFRRFPTPEEVVRYQGREALCRNESVAADAGVADPNAAAANPAPEGQAQPAATNAPAPAVAPGQTSAPLKPEEVKPAEGVAPPAPPGVQQPQPAAAATRTEPVAVASADGGVPTLASLMGDQAGVLERRMVKGFTVSLDREMRKNCRRYWRTQLNGFIPYDRLYPCKWSEFQGVHLEEFQWALPVGFLLSKDTFAYEMDQKGRLQGKGKPGYHYVFRIAGEETIKNKIYYRSQEGKYFRAASVTRIDAIPAPKEVAENEKWIDVDLGLQSLVAYQGSRPVFATLISSGKVDQNDPMKDFETPSGSFRILSKYLSHTMDGDHAVDGPYSIEDVPYVMYFRLAYALHSAFWHNGFGRPRSHGCVNIAPLDAKWLFNWVTPSLPVGWHAVFPTKEQPGTRLYVHGETPGKKGTRVR